MHFLEHLSEIEGLSPDPYYGGGGLHQMERRGFLRSTPTSTATGISVWTG